jgi:hypothetical protein
MKMKRLTALLIFSLVANLSQGQYLKMATIASSGSTSSSRSYVSQVVSQSSVIAGTESKQGMVFRQGFKQPMGLEKNTHSSGMVQLAGEGKPWSFQAYPNPFKDMLHVEFDQNTTLPARLTLYDLSGNIIWEQSYAENQRKIKLDKFQGLTVGKYILQVSQKGKLQSQSLIKEAQ